MISIGSQDAEDEWIVVPNDLQQASDRAIEKWSARAARSVLPKRVLRQDPEQFPIQASLAAAAVMTRPDESAFVLRAALPGSFLPVRLHWRESETDHRGALRQLVMPSLKQVTIAEPEPWRSPTGSLGLRATILREHAPHGWVGSFPFEQVLVQIKVDVEPRDAEIMEAPIGRLLSRLRVRVL